MNGKIDYFLYYSRVFLIKEHKYFLNVMNRFFNPHILLLNTIDYTLLVSFLKTKILKTSMYVLREMYKKRVEGERIGKSNMS